MEKKRYKLVGSKVGKIEKNEIVRDLFRSISVSTGVVLVATSLIYAGHNIKVNREKDQQIAEAVTSVNDSSYVSQIEKDLSIDLEDDYENDINKLCSYLYMIDNYQEEDAYSQYQSKCELVENYQDIVDTSLSLLKKQIATEKNVSVDRIGVYAGEEGYFAVIDGNLENRMNFHGDQLRLANSIASFQGFLPTKFLEDEQGYESYMNKMRNVILDSVKLVDQVEDYQLPDFVKFVR